MSVSPDAVYGQKKKLWHPIFDSERIATSGTTELFLFATPIGQGTSAHVGSGTKKLVDTNMRQGGMLSRGQAHKAMGLRVKFKPTTANLTTNNADIEIAQRTGLLELKIGDSKKIEQQLIDFNGGVGVDGFATSTASTTTVTSAHNGVAATEAIWWFKDVPVWFIEGQNIECRLSWPSAPSLTTALIVTVQFEGYLFGDIIA
mgnify:CR=1 FL=1